jgi:hypothetical protein
VYTLAKENTLNSLTQKFEKDQVAKSGEEFYLLTNDTNLFITSSILDLKKMNIPLGQYGTLLSIPNNTVIVALPLNDKPKIESFSLNFFGLTNYMYTAEDTKSLCKNVFWYDGKEIFEVAFDVSQQKLIYPAALHTLMGK